ncbi:hypothetical protein VTN00DRAFT_701 [Thermoascus crustaceus]|uniref:uncharacterized protein n=1 Tax=Thermoascus crustaceus TaxID=5088 RepID=UPI003742887C
MKKHSRRRDVVRINGLKLSHRPVHRISSTHGQTTLALVPCNGRYYANAMQCYATRVFDRSIATGDSQATRTSVRQIWLRSEESTGREDNQTNITLSVKEETLKNYAVEDTIKSKKSPDVGAKQWTNGTTERFNNEKYK